MLPFKSAISLKCVWNNFYADTECKTKANKSEMCNVQHRLTGKQFQIHFRKQINLNSQFYFFYTFVVVVVVVALFQVQYKQASQPASKRRKNNVYTHYCTMCLGNAEFYLVSFSFYFCCVVPNMVHEKHSTFSIKQAFDMKANQIKEIISHPFWLSCFVSLYILVLDK